MKMFVWTPEGHGQVTVSVAAENLEKATQAANDYVEEEIGKAKARRYDFNGWGTNYYVLKQYEPGQVAENAND